MFINNLVLKSRFWRYFSDINFSKDYYKVLGIPKTSTKAEIRKAYLNLAKTHHPDTATGNEEKFKQIGEAYEVLSDENTRKLYDAGPKKSEYSQYWDAGPKKSEYSQYWDAGSQYKKQSSYNWKNSSGQQYDQYYWNSSSKNSWGSNQGYSWKDWNKDWDETASSNDYYQKFNFKARKNYYKARQRQKAYAEENKSYWDYNDNYGRTGQQYDRIDDTIISFNIWLMVLSGIIILLLLKKRSNRDDYYGDDYQDYERRNPRPNVFADQLNLLNLNQNKGK